MELWSIDHQWLLRETLAINIVLASSNSLRKPTDRVIAGRCKWGYVGLSTKLNFLPVRCKIRAAQFRILHRLFHLQNRRLCMTENPNGLQYLQPLWLHNLSKYSPLCKFVIFRTQSKRNFYNEQRLHYKTC